MTTAEPFHHGMEVESGMTDESRLFIAVKLPPEVKRHLARGSDMLKQQCDFSRWVYEEDYHITLQFLGDVNPEKKDKILSALPRCAQGTEPFSLKLSGLGTFGREHQPRILWAGVSGDLDALYRLQKQVVRTMEPLGFPAEKRAYRPHVTIARKCRQPNFTLTPGMSSIFQNIEWRVRQIACYETKLGRQPMYEPVGLFSL